MVSWNLLAIQTELEVSRPSLCKDAHLLHLREPMPAGHEPCPDPGRGTGPRAAEWCWGTGAARGPGPNRGCSAIPTPRPAGGWRGNALHCSTSTGLPGRFVCLNVPTLRCQSQRCGARVFCCFLTQCKPTVELRIRKPEVVLGSHGTQLVNVHNCIFPYLWK